MSASDRSIVSILQGILENLQDLVRAELALAKREVADDVARARGAAVMLAAGAATLLLGLQFLLWAAVYALALRLPMWAAAAIVGGVFVAGSALAISAGLKRWRLVAFMPERTVTTVKENVAWIKQSIK